MHNDDPSLTEFQYLNCLKASAHSRWYYFHPRPIVSKLILDLPDNNKNWKSKWFFVYGNWGGELHEDGVTRSVPTCFEILVSNSSITVLRDYELDCINTVPEQDRDYRALLDLELLCRLGISASFHPKQGIMHLWLLSPSFVAIIISLQLFYQGKCLG
ncbi:hypothetical protein Ddye_021176 [Dipteronia dyeriana]|uniref:Uncharacterized protein n=1 Tax=Dipteronia dyeriana TaxID=168575 RepID=A0AAD9U1Y3_9ROSI|nr:hypothetical protein Ddye_021176 [Dipteronia dyeriana]